MNILQISTGFDISFNGGITNYVRNISSTLVDYGYNVTVLHSQDNGNKKKYNFNLINIDTILEPFHLNSVISNSDIKKIEEIIIEVNPDIIHVHMMIDLPIAVLKIFKKYSKVIISLHDYSFLCNRIILLDSDGNNCLDSKQNLKCNSCISYEETINNRLIRGVLRKTCKLLNIKKIANSDYHHDKFKYTQKLFPEMDGIIAVSNRVKDIYIYNDFNNDNFFVNHIGNYTAEDEFRNSFDKKQQKKLGQKLKFGFIGNLFLHKGSEIFLKLIENSDHEFHIYGGIDPNVLKQIKKYSQVYYHGKYSHEELKSILTNIDIGLVLPIWEDNAPQVIFEFLNSGIPIIGTKMGGLPDFINEKNGILFENNEKEINDIKLFMNSDLIYEFYNKKIGKIERTKKSKEHMEDLLKIYNDL